MESGKGRMMILGAIAITGTVTFLGNPLLLTQAQTSAPEPSPERRDLPEFCSFQNAAQQRDPQAGVEQSDPQDGVEERNQQSAQPTEVEQSQSDGVEQSDSSNSDLSNSEQSAPQEPETVIVVGKVPNAPYVVVVPGQSENALTAVRQCVPDAFQTRSQAGSYIRAGAFSRRSAAEELTRYLRSLKLDARVMYLP